jgi:hypothetical protein
MGLAKGLKELNKAIDKPSYNEGDGTKARWVKLEDGESIKIRFLQELDPDSPHYNEKNGLGFIANEHTNPADYRRKALCSMDDQGKCYGCEEHRKDYKKGWKARARMYVNVLVEDGKEEPYVAILSQGASGKAITPTVIEYAGEMGSISNLVWRIKRSGTKTDTSYTIIPLQKDEEKFDTSTLELYELEKVAVRDLAYTEQAAFFAGENGGSNEEDSSSSSSVAW